MADKKMTALTAQTLANQKAAALSDLLHVVDDPGGSPVNKKVTMKNFLSGLHRLTTSDDSSAYNVIEALANVNNACSGVTAGLVGQVNHHDPSDSTIALTTVYGVKGKTSTQKSTSSITGLNTAVMAELDCSSAATAAGNAYCMTCDMTEDSGSRAATPTAFIRFGDSVANARIAYAADYLFDLYPNTSFNCGTTANHTVGNLFANGATAATQDGTIRIKVNGLVRYLALYTGSS
jgi:hypothetical protein